MKIRQRLLAALFAAEYRELAELQTKCTELERSLTFAQTFTEVCAASPARGGPPARVSYRGRMTDNEIAASLAGTRSLPAIQAVLAKLEAELIAAGSAAGERPREPMVYDGPGGKTVIDHGYTETMRTHDAGGFDALARILGELQELTAAPAAQKQEGAS